jgi:hypothetical protein
MASLGPGSMLVRRVELDDDERWTVTIGLSLIIIYLLAFAGYLVDAPAQLALVIMAACAACCWAGRRSLQVMLSSKIGAAQAIGLGLVVVHGLLLDASIRNYNGLLWAGDWYEHYERAMFFILRPDARQARFLTYLPQPYLLPARPPMMNILAAEALSVGPPAFSSFQAVSTVLSSWACVPAVALAGRLARALALRPTNATYAAAAGLIVLPACAQNITFPWTKMLTAFFVLAAILMLFREKVAVSWMRLVLAGLFLGAALSVHYSAAVFALPIGIAVTLRAARSGRGAVAAAALAVPAALVLLPWLGYSLAVFGAGSTFGSNTTVTDAAGLGPVENGLKILLNIRDTVIPHFLRASPPLMKDLMQQGNHAARIRDWWFAPLQVNFPMAIGTISQLIVVAAIASYRRWPVAVRHLMGPWIPVLGVAGVLGVAVHGARDTLGLAHICLQPLILFAAAAAAVALPRLPVWVRMAAILGLGWDYVLGVILHFRLEALLIKVMPIVTANGASDFGNAFKVGGAATMNAYLKESAHLTFMGDGSGEPLWFLVAAAGVGFISLAIVARWALQSPQTPGHSSAAEPPKTDIT